MKNVGWLIAGVGAYLLYKGNLVLNTVKQLTYFIAGVKYNAGNSNAFRSELLVTLRVTNPNSTSINFQRFTGSVIVQGKNLAQIEVSQPQSGIVIQGNAQTDIAFSVIINHLSLVLDAKAIIEDLIKNGWINQPVGIVG